MRKITNRAISVLLIAALVICGMVVYVLRYIDHGQEWALYFSRANSGSTGQIYDRRGTSLAYFSGYENLFAVDEWTREANYHVTGDYWGRTGTAEVGDGTSNAWFVGFLDDEEHPYAFATMVERGGGGLSMAGTVTNQFLQDYFKEEQ